MDATLTAKLLLFVQYGPTLVRFIAKYGPRIWAVLSPLVRASSKAGTLAADLARLGETALRFGPALASFTTLGDVAEAIVTSHAAAVEDPAMERATGPHRFGGQA